MALDYTSYVHKYSDLLADYKKTGKTVYPKIEDYGRWHYESHGRREKRSIGQVGSSNTGGGGSSKVVTKLSGKISDPQFSRWTSQSPHGQGGSYSYEATGPVKTGTWKQGGIFGGGGGGISNWQRVPMRVTVPGGDKVFGWATKMDAGSDPDKWVFKYKERGMQDFHLILPDFDPVGKTVQQEPKKEDKAPVTETKTEDKVDTTSQMLQQAISKIESSYQAQVESLMQLLQGDPDPAVPEVDTASGLYGLEDTRKVKTQLTDDDLYKSSLFNLATRAPASGYAVVDPQSGRTYANAAMARSAGITNWVYKYAWDANT